MDAEMLIRISKDEPQTRIAFSGPWTVDSVCAIESYLEQSISDIERSGAARVLADLSEISHMDTSGAWMLYRFSDDLKADGITVEFVNVSRNQSILLNQVRENYKPCGEAEDQPMSVTEGLEEVGESVVATAKDVYTWTSVFGSIMAGLAKSIIDPSHIRPHSVITQIEQAGLRAVPIVALMSFLIGGIIAQQGAFQLRFFGAELFTVNLVGILVLREIGVLLTSIMVAGRSGSAFTAEIGSMQMREEVDALKIIGLNPLDVLVLPRLIALIIALPLLTVISNFMCIVGAMMVTWVYIDLPPAIFIQRLQDAIDLHIMLAGLIKAPFMATIIAIVACIEGLRVRGSAESLGRQTTAAVVKSIFMVIVVDGFFAIFFAAIDF